ncbi:MAG: hypothetical protein JWM57_886 [Phycisphaerales bacterium]|nr:hypothetical protein [Phycisphaerales bacterium]
MMNRCNDWGRAMDRRRGWGAAMLLGLVALTASGQSTPTTSPAAQDLALPAAAGGTVRPLAIPPSSKAVVLLFVSTECPISNSYAPTISKLSRQFADQGIPFFLIYADTDIHAAEALRHQKTYALPGVALLDPMHQLVRAMQATVTPEVVVVNPDGVICYRGAIDDQYAAVGRKRFAATQHYLSDALTQIVCGQTVAVKAVKPIGCGL